MRKTIGLILILCGLSLAAYANIYVYEQPKPGQITQQQLEANIPGPITAVGGGQAETLSLDIPASSKVDADDYLTTLGYEYLYEATSGLTAIRDWGQFDTANRPSQDVQGGDVGFDTDLQAQVFYSGTTWAITPADETPDGRVPVKQGGVFVGSAIRLDDINEIVISDWDLETPGNSIIIGPQLSMGSSSEGAIVELPISPRRVHHSVISPFNQTGSDPPHYPDLGVEFTSNIQVDDSQTITTNPLSFSTTYSLPEPNGIRQINNMVFRSGTSMTNVRMLITDNGTGRIAKYVPSRAAWDEGTGGLDFAIGDNTLDFASPASGTTNRFNLAVSLLIVEDGRQFDFEIVADNMALKGTSGNTPYQVNAVQDGFLLDIVNYDENGNIITSGDISVSGGTVVSTGDTLTNNFLVRGNGASGIGIASTNDVAGIYTDDNADMLHIRPLAGQAAQFILEDSTGALRIQTTYSDTANTASINMSGVSGNSVLGTAGDLTIGTVAGDMDILSVGAMELTATNGIDLINVDSEEFTDGSTQTKAASPTLIRGRTEGAILGVQSDLSAQDSLPFAHFIREDGKKYYVVGDANNSVFEYDLAIAGDVSSKSFVQAYDFSAQATLVAGIEFSPKGDYMYLSADIGVLADRIIQYPLTTSWSMGAVDFANLTTLDVSGQDTAPANLMWKPGEMSLFMQGGATDIIYEYTMTKASMVSGGSYSGNSFNPSEMSQISGFTIRGDGNFILIHEGSSSDQQFEYRLPTPWDIATTPELTNTFTTLTGFILSPIYSPFLDKFFMIDASTVETLEYNMGVVVSSVHTPLIEVDNVNADVVNVGVVGFSDGSTQSEGALQDNTNGHFQGNELAGSFPTSTELTAQLLSTRISHDASILFAADNSGGHIVGYDLSDLGEVTSAVYNGNTANTGQSVLDFIIIKSGTVLYTQSTTNILRRYTLATANDLTNIAGTGSVVFPNVGSSSLHVTNDGTEVYNSSGTNIYRSTLSDDGGTFTITDTGDSVAFGGAFCISDDKKTLWSLAGSNIREYRFKTPGVLSTLVQVSVIPLSDSIGGACFDINSARDRFYIVNQVDPDTVKQYNLGIHTSSLSITDKILFGDTTEQTTAFVGVIDGIDDVLSQAQTLTANRAIQAGNFSLDIFSANLLSMGSLDGARENSVIFEDGIGATLKSINGAAQTSMNLDYATGLNLYATNNKYILGDFAGGNLPPLTTAIANTDNFLTLDPTTGEMGQFSQGSVSRLPPEVHQIFSDAELNTFATAGVITVTADTVFLIQGFFATSVRFVSTDGFTLIVMSNTGGAGLIYTGTADLFSGNGSLIIEDMFLISVSTGTLFNMTLPPTNFVSAQDSTISGFDDMGTMDGGVATFSTARFIDYGASLKLDNLRIVDMDFVNGQGGAASTPLFAITNNSQAGANYRFGRCGQADVNDLVRVDPSILSDTFVGVSQSRVPFGEIFDITGGSTGTFTAAAPAVVASTAVTSVIDSPSTPGVARFVFTPGPTLFVDQEITTDSFIVVAYNATGFITATGAGYFEIASTPYSITDTGNFSGSNTTLTDTGTTLVDGDTLVIDTDSGTTYDGGYTVYNQLTNSFQINKAYSATATGSWDTSGIDQEDPRVLADNNPGFEKSHYIATAYVNDNVTANGTIVNNTFTDMTFGTVGSALIGGSTMERWKLTSGVSGVFEYTGNEPFDGFITFDFTVLSAGGIVNYRFKWVKDSGAGYVDLADTVQGLTSVGSDSESITKTFPLRVVKGDRIKPQITRDSGGSSITTTYATIYAAQQ